MEEVLPMETLSPSCLGFPGRAMNTGTDLENVSSSMLTQLWENQTVPGCGMIPCVHTELSTFANALSLPACKFLVS